MSLSGYLHVVRARWRIILAGLVLGLAIGAGVTFSQTPKYGSSVTMFVAGQGADQNGVDAYQLNLLSQQKVASYVELLTSNRLAQSVLNDTKLPLTAGKLKSEISASSQPNTVLITATVVDKSAQRAQQLANSVGNQFSSLIAKLEAPPGGGKPTVAVRTVQPAQLSSTPVSPKPVRDIGLGALLGLLLGVAAAFARHALDTSVKDVDELAELTGAPSLGSIAFDPEMQRRPLVVQLHPHAARAESFRQIRTALQFIDIDRPRKVIALTSSLPEEGKTTTLCNLAIVLAQAGSGVALVEGDMRRPRAARYLGLEGAGGLSNVLAGQATLEDVLQPWGDGLFSVVASGALPPNPSELLGSERMQTVLADLSATFDVVLVDTPPLLPVTDAAAVAAHCDGVILIARQGATARDQVRTATATLTGVGARILGSVLTMVPAQARSRYSYSYAPDPVPGGEAIDRPPVGANERVPSAAGAGTASGATSGARSGATSGASSGATAVSATAKHASYSE